jgi:hypothetical protein
MYDYKLHLTIRTPTGLPVGAVRNQELTPYVYINYRGKKIFVEVNIPEPKYLINNKSQEKIIMEESENIEE